MDEAAWKAFGEWIEQRREHAGLTVGELAERAGVSRVWLQVLRKGGRRIEGEWRPPNPKSAALARVARALDVPVEEMFARAGRDAAPQHRSERARRPLLTMTSGPGPSSAFASSRNGLHAPSRRWQSCDNSLSASELSEPTSGSRV